MKYLIKIDKDSIRKNPNAGQTMTITEGPQRPIMFIYQGGPVPEFFDNEDVRIYSNTVRVNSRVVEITGYLYNHNMLNELIEATKGGTLQYSINENSQTLYHNPLPEYYFDYIPTQIICSNCKESFDYSELLSDSIDENYSNEICPKCNYWGCCEIEYEKLKESK